MRPADSAAPVLAEVIANSARLRRWRWLSATSTSTRRAPRPGATIRARAGRGRRPSAAAGWAARGSCRCAAGTEASCPSIWLRGSIRWPAISPSGFSPGRSCHSGSVASPPAALTDAERAELHELFCDQREQLDQALEILERVGYGRPRGRRPRTERAHGKRRGDRLDGLVGKLPRALAKRLPTSADTHRSGSNGRTSTAASPARKRSAQGISGSSRPPVGCGTRATPPPARTPRRPRASSRS